MTPPPPLPYAPRRRRPLSLWNPLDYLVLLYWVFYFPQALRWYVETFAELPADVKGWQAVRQDAIQRRLALQGLLASIVTTFGFAFFLSELGFQTNWSGVAAGVAYGVAMLRLDAALMGLLPAWLQPSRQLAITWQRVSPLPIWGLHRRLAWQLREDWQRGLDHCEGLLRYSLQFGPVIAAIQEALQNTPDERLLSRIADWCSMSLYDWRAVFHQSASLQAALKQKFWDGFFIVPRRWRPKIMAAPRYDTPARATCAGFWHLHKGELAKAADAFAAVRLLPHGEELHENAQALAAAGNCRTLELIAVWQPSALLQGEPLRPQVRAAFARLAEVAKDIDLVFHARSTRQRSSALNRASGRLHGFPAESADCPTPERPQLEKIAAQWLDIILASAGPVGSLEVREPVASPYIVGAPVPAARLAGRQDVLARIEAAWAKSGLRDSLVIFGHRRMGKTSVARRVPQLCRLGDDTRLAFLNLQIVDWTEGLSDLCHAIAFALWEADPNGLDEPASEDYERHPLATLRRLLSRLGQSTPPRRYILVLDEYELLEEKLPDAVAGDRTALLRGLTQQHPWLALGLVGLHSLQERSASLREAIFGWRPIPVGLMDQDAFADLLQIEEDALPLEYGLDAISRAHQLTGGQPFLGQLLGDNLVQRFNQQLKQQLEPPAPTFTAADVDAVVEDSRFYLNGHVYFNGIWAQAGEAPPGQRALLKILADCGDGLDQNAWRDKSSLDPAAFEAALDALERHDVVNCQNGTCRYSVELMRRWVAGHAAAQ